VKRLYKAGDHAGALRASTEARNLNITGTVVGIAGWAIVFIFIIVFVAVFASAFN
jgi:hypothetical protein